MFAVGWSEVLLIALAAVIFLKPRDLPRLMRRIGILAGRMKELMGSVSRDLAELASEDAEDGGRAEAEGFRQAEPSRFRTEVRRALGRLRQRIRGDKDVGSGRGGQAAAGRPRPAGKPPEGDG